MLRLCMDAERLHSLDHALFKVRIGRGLATLTV